MIKLTSRRAAGTRPAASWTRWTAIGLAALAASGCAVFDDEKVDYRSAKRASTLEVPPDLSQLSRDTRYIAPTGPVTAAGMQVQQPAARPVALTEVSGMRIERAGNQRWLVLDRAPDRLWDSLRDFWKDSGFNLAQDQEQLGIMETEWAENRAKLPQDIIRAAIGKVLDGLYSTGERDRFRTRIERNAQGGTEIYVSHRGMIEVYTDSRKEGTAWQPRPSDPELEAEFLRRLMLKLGTRPEQAKALLAAAPQPAALQITSVDGQPALQIAEGFDRAWRRVGLALDRTGFTVEDRDRARGVYFVRYVGSIDIKPQEKQNFFLKLFSSSAKTEATPARYRIQVKSGSGPTAVSVLNAEGRPDASGNAQKILQLLAEDLK